MAPTATKYTCCMDRIKLDSVVPYWISLLFFLQLTKYEATPSAINIMKIWWGSMCGSLVDKEGEERNQNSQHTSPTQSISGVQGVLEKSILGQSHVIHTERQHAVSRASSGTFVQMVGDAGSWADRGGPVAVLFWS